MPEPPLPNDSNPPVIETVLGVQFRPIDALTSAHLGAYWTGIESEWPVVETVQPLLDQQELFGDEALRIRPQFSLSTSPPVGRLKIRDGDRKTKLIQVQPSRFVYNWIKNEEHPDYPHYTAVRSAFDDALSAFAEFLRRRLLGPIEPTQWEVTYVNHVARGDSAWPDGAAPSAVFPRLVGSAESVDGLRFENFNSACRYEIPPQRGRLHAELSQAVRTFDESKPVDLLVLKLTARGPITPEQGLDAGLNLGHDTIVRAFAAVSSKEANEAWGRTQ